MKGRGRAESPVWRSLARRVRVGSDVGLLGAYMYHTSFLSCLAYRFSAFSFPLLAGKFYFMHLGMKFDHLIPCSIIRLIINKIIIIISEDA